MRRRGAQCCVGQLRRSYKRNRDAGRERDRGEKRRKSERTNARSVCVCVTREVVTWGYGPLKEGGRKRERKKNRERERWRERDESSGVSQL